MPDAKCSSMFDSSWTDAKRDRKNMPSYCSSRILCLSVTNLSRYCCRGVAELLSMTCLCCSPLFRSLSAGGLLSPEECGEKAPAFSWLVSSRICWGSLCGITKRGFLLWLSATDCCSCYSSCLSGLSLISSDDYCPCFETFLKLKCCIN